MKLDRKKLENYPDVLSKEQLIVVAHMSKRTASYLLESKMLPSINTGKKTRCYQIKKQDIIEFFDNLASNPTKYSTPPNWYSEKKKMKAKPYTLRLQPNAKFSKSTLRAYYTRKLKDYDELLFTTDVSEFTGYNLKTVTSWIRSGKLEVLHAQGRNIIPKELLLRWITSDRYNAIERKSQPHLRALWDISE